MKKLLLTCILAIVMAGNLWAAKSIYIPSGWSYNSSTGEYTQDGYSYSMSRKRESDNFVVFWSSEYGNTAPDALSTSDFYYVNIDDLLNQAEQFYALYAETLKFVDPTTSTTMSQYKCMIMLMHSDVWAAYGGGFDFVVPALWINPATCKPVGHTIAHEVGHSFHYMCFAEANNHNPSSSVNTGFHLACGNGQAIWEQTAQWQAAMAFPQYMFTESYPLFGNNANYAFSHEWMRYQSYWFHYYLCQYYNDLTTVAQVWNTPMTGQSEGNGTDFCQAYIKLKNLNAAQFYERYFDYAMHCATFDFDRAAAYRNDYIGNFDYRAVMLAPNKYQVAYSSAPQSTGFNVIELNVPASGTTVTTNLTALTHGCALANGDPGQYNNGNANSLVSAGVSNYNTAGTASYRGFRFGYVFLKADGTREYYNDNTVHCTGTAEKTESISTTVPANTSRMFLVVMPSLTTYVQHKWDENIKNDDQWPYQFELVNTSAKSVTPYIDEPDFTKQIDGRNISDVTLTYNVVLPVDASGYTGTGVAINSGSAVNALCTAFQLESSAIFGHVIDYTASQGNNTIMSCALTSAGAIQANAKNTNGTFGHWFNASGTVADWGNNTVVFTEYDNQYASCTVGQFPGANTNGTTRTVREGLIYKDSNGNTAKATIIYNVTFDSNLTAGYAYLADIDYVEPSTASTSSATAFRARSIQNISLTMMQGNTATSDAIDSATLLTALNGLSETYLTNANSFRGYYDPMTSITAGNYVYYYALDGAPRATTTNQGTLTYYQTASVNNDADFSGQYVHYYNASSGCISNAADAKLKVAYDRANKTFSVKAAADCPVGTYTVWMGMVRRTYANNLNRIWVGYFPITITVTENRETDDWPDITTLPEDYSKWFFIFKDHYKNLYLTLRDGVHQAGESDWSPKTMWYSGQNADKPEVSKNSLWTLDYYELDGSEYQLITSPMYRNYMLQNEWQGAWYWRTHDNGGGGYGWGRASFSYNGTSWVIQNGQHGLENHLGPWDDQFVDGAEVAFNKTGASIGYFDVSAILRGEYVATYEDLTAVDYNNPLDITYCLENEGGERMTTIGWKSDGGNWATQTNTSLQGKQGTYYFQIYNASGIGNADMYQTVYGLPAGYYRFSAVMNGRNNQYLYANDATAQATIGSNGESVSVIVQINAGDELRVGAKAVNSTETWIAFDEAKLEYLGTSLPSAHVGTPTPSIPDGAYIQSLASLTFAFSEAASDTETFALINPSATVAIEKNGSALAQGTLSLNGTNLNVAFGEVTIEPNTTYTVTLPADVVGYQGFDSNEAVTLTWHSPLVFDGTYYLYNTDEQKYIGRGGVWATSAIVDDWGLAIILNTDIAGATTLKFFDNQRYIFNDGFCYGDGETGLQLTMEQAANGYKFLNRSNNRYMAIWGGRVVGDAAEGDNLVGTTNVWALESAAEHIANYTRNADTQAATAATSVPALASYTTQAALESALTAGYAAVTVDEQYNGETGMEKYQVYAAQQETLAEAEYEKYTLTDMKPGLYRLTVDAFQRAAWFDWVYDNDGARGEIYAYVNGAKTQLKSVTEYTSATAFTQDWERDGNHYVNGIPAAYPVLDEGHYRNVVYVYVPANEGAETATITYGINNPNRLGNDLAQGTWCCYKNFKLERLIPNVVINETDLTAPAQMNDVALTFNRTIVGKDNVASGNAWNTICFPFSMSEELVRATFGENVRVMEMSDVILTGDHAAFKFADVTSIEANKPYIMQTDQAAGQYTFTGIDITPSEQLTTTVNGVDFVGTYVAQTPMPNTNGSDYFLSNDVFKKSNGNTKIKGFRGYFHVPNASGIKSLSMDIDGQTTSIDLIGSDDELLSPSDIYSVGGQLIRRQSTTTDDLPAGIYIVNGRKVIKR